MQQTALCLVELLQSGLCAGPHPYTAGGTSDIAAILFVQVAGRPARLFKACCRGGKRSGALCAPHSVFSTLSFWKTLTVAKLTIVFLNSIMHKLSSVALLGDLLR